MLIKFRAECQHDVDRFLKIIPKDSLVSYKVKRMTLFDGVTPVLDKECEFETENLTLDDLNDMLSHVPDSHIMQQTLALAEDYTGNRDHDKESPDHKERHILLHKMLDELASDYISHTEKLLRETTVLELLQWSYQQTIEPNE